MTVCIFNHLLPLGEETFHEPPPPRGLRHFPSSQSIPIPPTNTSTKSAFTTWSANGNWWRPSNSSARRTKTAPRRGWPSSLNAPLLRKGVAVSVVDLVTIRRFNLYAQLMEFIGHPDRTMSADGPPIYAASCRWVTRGTRARLEAWSHTLIVGEPLPTLPLWLSDECVVTLNLEPSYEQACSDLRIV